MTVDGTPTWLRELREGCLGRIVAADDLIDIVSSRSQDTQYKHDLELLITVRAYRAWWQDLLDRIDRDGVNFKAPGE